MKKKMVEKITKISLAMLTTLCISSQLCGCAITASSGSIETTDMEQTVEMEDMTALGQTTANADQVSDKQSNITSNSIDDNTSDDETGSNLIVSNDGSAAAEGSWEDVKIEESEQKPAEGIDYNIKVENEGTVTDYTQLAIYQTEAGKSTIDYVISGTGDYTFAAIVNNKHGWYAGSMKKSMDLETAIQEYKDALVKEQPTTPEECTQLFYDSTSQYINWDGVREAARKWANRSNTQNNSSQNSSSNSGNSSSNSGSNSGGDSSYHNPGPTPEEIAEAGDIDPDSVYTNDIDWDWGWDTDSIGQ